MLFIMYVAEIRKKTIRLLLKCIGVYIILALTLNIQLTLGMGVISFIYFLYRINLVKKNEIIDCDKYPYYKEWEGFYTLVGIFWAGGLIIFHFYHIFTYSG